MIDQCEVCGETRLDETWTYCPVCKHLYPKIDTVTHKRKWRGRDADFPSTP